MKLNEMEVHDLVRLRIPDVNSKSIVEMDGELTILTMDAYKRVEFFQIERICKAQLIVCRVEVRYGPGTEFGDEDIKFWVDIKYSVPADSAELTVTRVEHVEI